VTDVAGRKKDPNDQPRPYEATDTLRSVQTARIIDLVSEGPIEGLIDGKKSVFFDDIPLQNADGSENFTGAVVESRNGTFNQAVFQNVNFTERSFDVGIEVKHGDEPSRVVYDENVDVVVFRVGVNGLSFRDAADNVVGTSVMLELYVTGSDNVRMPAVPVPITGKASTHYARDVAVSLPAGKAPWTISVKRVTEDYTETADRRLNNVTTWDAYTERLEEKFNYPYSALCAVTVDSRHFTSIPTRRYNIRGRKVRVPHNRLSDLSFGSAWGVGAPQYGGFFNGTFKADEEWTRNPAWCLYDVLTNERYGLGQYFNPGKIPGDAEVITDLSSPYIDKWALYEVGKYCDELVPDGKGGFEPRFALNCYIQNQSDAYQLIAQLTSVFRGMLLWANSGAVLASDRPQDPLYIFTNSNVVDGEFTYSGSSRRSRLTAVYVAWNNPKDGYRRAVEYVEDPDGMARYGVNTTELTAFGCTSQAQARRVGLWAIYTSVYETEQITFTTGTQAATLLPGQIVNIQDEHRSGMRWGGFVRSAGSEIVTGITTPYIDVDSPVELTAGVQYQLYYTAEPDSYTHVVPGGDEVILEAGASDGGYHAVQRGEARVHSTTVTVSTTGSYTRLHIGATRAGELPAVGSIWNLSQPTQAEALTCRVLNVSEAEGGKFSVTVVQHYPDKFHAIENGIKIPDDPFATTIRPLVPRAVAEADVKKLESLYLENQVVKSALLVSWNSPGDASAYRVRVRYNGASNTATNKGTWAEFGTLNEPSFTLQDTRPGWYDIEITALSVFGLQSAPLVKALQVEGKLKPPSDVDANTIKAEIVSGGIAVSWKGVTDLDLSYYIVKALPLDRGEFFGREEVIAESLGTSALYSTAYGKGSVFLITVTAVDTSGVPSLNAAAKEFTFAPPGIVENFTIASNLGYLDFYWKPVAGAVNYQLRAGAQWESAELIGETSAPQLSVEWSRDGEKVFWIRAYDALGNPSPLPTSETLDVAKPPSRNVVLTDVEEPTFPGYKYNMDVIGVDLQIAVNKTYGEYFHEHAIGAAHDVLVTIDNELLATFESGLTWADFDFPWNDSRADQTWTKLGEVSQIEVEHYVATNAANDAAITDLWSFTTAAAPDIGTATPTTVGTLAFDDGLFGDGLIAGSGLTVEQACPDFNDEFTVYWTYRVLPAVIGRRMMRIEGAGTFWDLVYDNDELKFRLQCSDGVAIDLARRVDFDGSTDSLLLILRSLGFPYQQFGVIADTSQLAVETWLSAVTAGSPAAPAWRAYTTQDYWPRIDVFLALLAAAAPYLAPRSGPEYAALSEFGSRELVEAGVTFALAADDMVFFAMSQFSETKVVLGQNVTTSKRSLFVRKHGDSTYLYGEVAAAPMEIATVPVPFNKINIR
jgi:predicted phage tail protein